jgi:hypothetical protein
MKKSQTIVVASILALSVVASTLILSATAQTSAPAAKPADDPYQKIFDEQVTRTKRYEALLAKQEELMKKQDSACTHYLAILDKWDKQQTQYQKYLDSLPAGGGGKK